MNNRGCCLLIGMEECFERKPLCSVFRCLWENLLALFVSMMKNLKEKCRNLFNSRGCFGCCTKPSVFISAKRQSKRLKNRGRQATTNKSLGAEFWSSSAGEMDNSTVPSQRSVSSISTSNLTLDSTTNNPSEFINHGFLLWNQIRQQWVGNRESQKRAPVDEPRISFDATYENLLGTNKPFPQPIPLSEMVDFLVDVWEQDGLYD